MALHFERMAYWDFLLLQVLRQQPALLFLGGPPEDVKFALERHDAVLSSRFPINPQSTADPTCTARASCHKPDEHYC